MALEREDARMLADAIVGTGARGQPFRGWSGEQTEIELRANITRMKSDGTRERIEVTGKPGEAKTYPHIVVPLEQAQMYQCARVARIIGPAKPIEVRGKEKGAS